MNYEAVEQAVRDLKKGMLYWLLMTRTGKMRVT